MALCAFVTIGILLVAFPTAHGVILTSLYLPVAIMLIGLILRGVAFEFRVDQTHSPRGQVKHVQARPSADAPHKRDVLTIRRRCRPRVGRRPGCGSTA